MKDLGEIAMVRPLRFALGFAVCAAAVGALPAAAMAGSISGTVTAEAGGAPIQGVEVCPRRDPYTVETACTVSDGSGNYSLNGLPEGSYAIYFSADPTNLKYVSEFYDDKHHSWEATLVTIGASQALAGIDARLAEGGSIKGTVTDETTGLPIAGIEACAINHEGIPARCSDSGPNGEYQLNGLPSGEYSVEFESGNRVNNYLRIFYEDAESWAEAKEVAVSAPAVTANIDARLAPGAQILGRVTAVGTGAPLAEVSVCAEKAEGEGEGCAHTEPNGEYAIRSLRAGTYLVAFGRDIGPFGPYAAQWWNGASAAATATPITIAPPEIRSGIDGQVPAPPGASDPPPPSAALPTAPESVISKRPRPAKCHKGFHRKQVHGKSRCVKKKAKHRHLQRSHR